MEIQQAPLLSLPQDQLVLAAPPQVIASTHLPATNVQDDIAGQTAILHISNSDFIAATFPKLPEAASALVCSKTGDPSQGGWPPVPADRLTVPLPRSTNNYLNCASFRPDATGAFKARKENFAACHFIMLDDIGSKVAFERLGTFKVSWLIETSPGNHQVGILLDPPLDTHQATRLLSAIIDADLCDPGATGPSTRWARLPEGINGKEKYRSADGEPFQCRLIQWNPQSRYSSQAIIDGLGLALAEDATPILFESKLPVPLESQGLGDPAGKLAKLKALLDVVSSDYGYSDWLKVLMAIFHETGGSEEGLWLADHWSSKGRKYQGSKDIQLKWASFGSRSDNPVTIRTLMSMARATGVDVPALMLEMEDRFIPSETIVVPVENVDHNERNAPNYLDRFSISEDIEALERQMVEQVPLLGQIALMGQATAIFAQGNTGKTLLVLYLLIDAIKNGRVDPKKLYYLNMDDNSKGLLEKARLANEYGFKMMADGQLEFDVRDFRKSMEAMIESDTARGVVVILDTLKKFVNTMDKTNSADFTKLVRRFVLKGGTIVSLGHTNKNKGSDGKSKFAGTSDICDDFDCAYILDTVLTQDGQRIVEFENIKKRGNVVSNAGYSYSAEDDIDYSDLLLSIQEVDELQLNPVKKGLEIKSDLPFIAAIRESIAKGTNTKMKLIDEVKERLSVPGRSVGKVIVKYTGVDPVMHYWKFMRGERGAQIYTLLS
jgi:hypothetical protein